MKRALATFLCLFIVLCARAQYAPGADSTVVAVPYRQKPELKFSSFVAPTLLIGSGSVLHCLSHDAVDLRMSAAISTLKPYGTKNVYIEEVLQYLPLAASLGLEYLGVETPYSILDRGMDAVMGVALLTVTTKTIKALVPTSRPNSSDDKSFPSGHSALAFAGAELVRLQYGNTWGAAAYGTAALVSYLRVFHSEHWMSDVLMGAGIGILSAHLGDLVLSPLKSLFNIRTGIYVRMDSVSGAVCPALSFNF